MRSLTIFLAVVLSSTCLTIAQNYFCIEGFVFRVDSEKDKQVSIIDPLSYPSKTNPAEVYHDREITSLTIPETVQHPVTKSIYTVTAVYLTNNQWVEEISIPKSVKWVNAVSNFPNLKTLDIPEGITLIGDIRDLAIENLKLPSTLMTIKPDCLPSLSKLSIKALYIPENVNEVEYAIYECDNLELLEMPGTQVMTNSIEALPSLRKLVFSPKLREVFSAAILLPKVEEIWFPSDGNEYPWEISTNSFLCKPQAVYCERPNPPTFDRDLAQTFRPGIDKEEDFMFHGPEGMKDIVLYVRPECVEAYRSTPNWGLMDIRPYDFTNNLPLTVADIEPAADGKLYDLAGREVTASAPTPGIYIRNGKKTAVK